MATSDSGFRYTEDKQQIRWQSISTELDIGRDTIADLECKDHVVLLSIYGHKWAVFLAGHQSPPILSTPLLVENIFSSKSHPLYVVIGSWKALRIIWNIIWLSPRPRPQNLAAPFTVSLMLSPISSDCFRYNI